MLAPFGARFPTADPFRPATIRSVHADGDTVIVVWDGRGIANDGQPYENSYAWIMTTARRQGRRRHRLLRQHLVQRPLDSYPTTQLIKSLADHLDPSRPRVLQGP